MGLVIGGNLELSKIYAVNWLAALKERSIGKAYDSPEQIERYRAVQHSVPESQTILAQSHKSLSARFPAKQNPSDQRARRREPFLPAYLSTAATKPSSTT